MRWSVLLGLFALASTAWPAEPVRAIAITQHGGLVERAVERFQSLHGAGLFDLQAVNPDVDVAVLENANAVFVYYIPTAEVARLRPALARAQRRGAKVIVLPESYHDPEGVFKPDMDLAKKADEYWKNGGLANITGFVAWLYREAGGKSPISVPDPIQELTKAIYHPRTEKLFSSLADYLAWYQGNGWNPDAPLVGVSAYSNSYKFEDLGAVNAIVTEIESRGLGAVPIFGWPLGDLTPLLEIDGRSPLRVLLAMNVSVARPEDPLLLEKYGLHTINLISTRESRAEWERSETGLVPGRLYALLNAPERVGATEPILAATTEIASNGSEYTAAVPERIRTAVNRAERWIALQQKSNSDKRVVLLYYNNPPGKGNIGANYLQGFEAIRSILLRLRDEGYRPRRTPENRP